jgi:hypothetical protein
VFDVAMLELILASGIEFIGPEEPDSWRRLLVIIKDGLRAQRRRPTPQTAPPLTNEGLDRAMKRSARRARG